MWVFFKRCSLLHISVQHIFYSNRKYSLPFDRSQTFASLPILFHFSEKIDIVFMDFSEIIYKNIQSCEQTLQNIQIYKLSVKQYKKEHSYKSPL